MSWGLGWKRSSDVFHLTLSYGEDEALDESTPTSSRSSSSASTFLGSSPSAGAAEGQEENTINNLEEELLGFRVELDWNVGDDEDQVALKLQSQVMVALPLPQDTVEIEFKEKNENENGNDDVEEDITGEVAVEMRVVKRREPLKGVMMWRVGSSSQQSDGMGVLSRLMRSNFANRVGLGGSGEGVPVGCADHWKSVTVVSLCGLGLMVSGSSF